MKPKIIFSKRLLKDTKKLKKKYKNIAQDLQDFCSDIENNKIIGDKIKGLTSLSVYKTRIKNSSINSGKSGGFRVIYYAKVKEIIYLITIYSKSDQENIEQSEILEILKQENLIL
jgi:mRNA-degrading endonuclease RelE of RelBE toxin-antitoxin system